MSQQSPRLPEPGEFVRGVGTLREIKTIPPPPQPPPKTVYVFEETTAEIQLRLGNKTIQALDTYNDFYGKETSVQAAIDDAREYMRRHRLSKVSDLEVVVVRMVSTAIREPNQLQPENFYDKTFVGFTHSPLCHPEQVETEVVWSSKQKVKKVPKP